MKVLILSATASAINVIQALRDEPSMQLFVTDANRYAPGLYLAGVHPLVVPKARDHERYRAALDEIIARHQIDVLIPTSDRDVEGVVTLLDAGWNPPVRMFRPSLAAQQLLAHKGRLMSLLSQRMPQIIPLTLTASEVGRASELAFPLIAKPVDEGGSRDVAIVSGAAELDTQVRKLRSRYGDGFVLQEFIPGGIGSTYVVLVLYDEQGRLHAGVSMQSHLTYLSWGGGGNAGAMVHEPEMIEWADRVIQACGGWKGPLNFEFRKHAQNGKIFLMEANCRLNGYSYLTTMNGFNFPRAMVSILTNQSFTLPSQRDTMLSRTFILGFREQLVNEWAAAPRETAG